MMPTLVNEAASVPPPAYHRAQARLGPALHSDALTLVNTLHLLTFCRLAVRLAHHRCPPPLPKGPGGAPRAYREESLLLIALLRTLWRLSYADMRDWLRSWPALALACSLPLDRDGHPRIPSSSQQCKRGKLGGAPLPEALFVLSVLTAVGSSVLAISLSIVSPLSPGTVPTLMQPLAMLPLSILVHSYAAIAFIPSSVVVRAYPSFFSFLPPMSMMHPSPNHCWRGPCSCIASVRA